jgi:hypothetical protein
MTDDAKTLPELVDKVGEIVPLLDDKVEDMLRRYPDLVMTQTNERGEQTIRGYNLGRIVAIALLDFLCWAYDRPHLGYMPEGDEHPVDSAS